MQPESNLVKVSPESGFNEYHHWITGLSTQGFEMAMTFVKLLRLRIALP